MSCDYVRMVEISKVKKAHFVWQYSFVAQWYRRLVGFSLALVMT
jgi:hypothetical protein